MDKVFGKRQQAKKSEDVKKSAAKVLDPKRDTATRSRHLRIFLDNADQPYEVSLFFENHYSHIFYIVYDAFVAAEQNLRQKGSHKAQREELESVLYLLEKVLVYLPEHLGRKWQFHAMGRLMSKLLHPGNSWKLIKREAMRLFLLWYQVLGNSAGDQLHAMFATLVPDFPSPYQGMGLTALAALTPDTTDGPVNPAEICPLIPPQSGERWKSPETDLTRIFLDVLLELMVSQVPLIEWKDDVRDERQRACFNFLFDRFKMYYMPHIFPDFNWTMSLYRPALELPETRQFRPAFVDCGDGTKKIDPMLACRVVVIKWIAQYTHQTRSSQSGPTGTLVHHNMSGGMSDESDGPVAAANSTLNMSTGTLVSGHSTSSGESGNFDGGNFDGLANSGAAGRHEGALVREILYANREDVNFVHEVYRQAFLLGFNHSPAIKKVITVYKDWIYMNVPELPPFLLEPLSAQHLEHDGEAKFDGDVPIGEPLVVRAGLQNVLQIFVTNASNVFLLQVSSEYPILLEEQVDLCKRVLNIYRYMVMNVKMEPRTWEQLLFVLLQITQLTLPNAPPRRREDTLGGRLAQAIFQTLIVTWIKANLYVVVSTELWDQFLDVLSSLTLWEELVREWAKTMETLTRVLARQVYNLDLNDLPLDRLTERAQKKKRGKLASAQQSDLPVYHQQQSKIGPPQPLATQHLAPTSNHDPAGAVGGHESGVTSHSGGNSGNNSIVGPSKHLSGSSPSSSRKRLHSESTDKYHHHKKRHSRYSHNRRLHRLNRLHRRTLSSSDVHFEPTPLICGDANQSCIVSGMALVRSRSLDSWQTYLSEQEPRSSSPAPSGVGVDCASSLKDSPVNALDQDNVSEGGSIASDMFGAPVEGGVGGSGGGPGGSQFRESSSSASSSTAPPRSVMSGGTVKGWLPDVAVVLWRRMLGSLGNINAIQDTSIHAQIYKYLIELFEIMVKIRNNQGVSIDNLSTPPPPVFVPPFTIFAPWCFRALNLPEHYQRGRNYALRLLCLLTCRQHDTPLPKTHLVQFYKVLHGGLTGQKMDSMNTLVKFTGPRFFSLMLPGYTAYILDFLYAANCIISTSELKGVPRNEATTIVGTLLAFPPVVKDLPLLLPSKNELTLISSAEVKDQIIGVLLKSGKKEPAGLARCISLSSLGIFVYSELLHESFHPKIKEAIQVLLTALRFNNKAVAQIASDMLLLLADHVKNFLEFYPEVPKKIVEVLARTLAGLAPPIPSPPTMAGGGGAGRIGQTPRPVTNPIGEDEKRLLLSLLFCLGEWVMRVPRHILTQPVDAEGRNLLHHVFSALLTASGEPPGPTPAQMNAMRRENAAASAPKIGPAVMIEDPFDPSNQQATLIQQHMSDNNAVDHMDPPGSDYAAEYDDPNKSHPIRLASKTILSHLVNHLFHFPMCAGAASLSSMINEQDDNPFVANDSGSSESAAANSCQVSSELSPEIFKTPNVQLFVLNDSTLMSFVELSNADTVRIIFRDISGKFSWDVTPAVAVTQWENPQSGGGHQQDHSADGSDWLSEMMRANVESRPLDQHLLNEATSVLRARNAETLPVASNDAEDFDNLNDLLQHIGHTSPELLVEVSKPLNAIPSRRFLEDSIEQSCITGVLAQKQQTSDCSASAQRLITENQVILEEEDDTSLGSENSLQTDSQTSVSHSFQQARKLFSQLGFTSWEKRPDIHLLKKGDQLLRELKHLDAKKCRETHKIAVIYVAEGQEDKQSILSNSSGSQAYEEFVSGLGWEVELDTHAGFMGGLSKNRVTGETSVYYTTSFVEVMFHVATRMPSNSEESMLSKTRHLGNDEVHVVWSEHWRDYRRGILPTEFCDVLIIVYPLSRHGNSARLFRVQITRKPDVPYFGPLFNDVIVDGKILPGLIRATAVNASRAKRSMLSHFQSHYEERHVTLTSLISHHKLRSSFEEFTTLAYSPAPLTNLFIGDPYISNSRLAGVPMSAPVPAASTAPPPLTRSDLAAPATTHEPPNEAQTSPRNLKKLTANIKATLQGHHHTTTQKRGSVSAFEQLQNTVNPNINNNQAGASSSSISPSSAAINLHSRLKRN